MNAMVVSLATAILAGLIGAAAMELVMWIITRTGWTKGNMVVALGSLVTRSRGAGAWLVGGLIHIVAGIAFAYLYMLALVHLGFVNFPQAQVLGLVMGFIHGAVVSIALVWVVAEQHPLEEFSKAGFEVGLTHLAGHIAFGLAVGATVAAAY